jgi:hypothetical protein
MTASEPAVRALAAVTVSFSPGTCLTGLSPAGLRRSALLLMVCLQKLRRPLSVPAARTRPPRDRIASTLRTPGCGGYPGFLGFSAGHPANPHDAAGRG